MQDIGQRTLQSSVSEEGADLPDTSSGLRDGQLNSKPFSCNVCKRSYNRADHLSRHYRSHTRERPFKCTACGKGFSRSDLLRRHYKNHKQQPNEPGKASHSRAVQACLACAGAKLRCEGAPPCRRCSKRGIVCEFDRQRATREPEIVQPSDVDHFIVNIESTYASDLQMQDAVNQTQQTPYQDAHPQAMLNTGNDKSTIAIGPAVHSPFLTEVPAGQDMMLGNCALLSLPSPQQERGEEGRFEQSDVMTCHQSMPVEPSTDVDSFSVDFDELAFLDFLRNVMTPAPDNGNRAFCGDFVGTYGRDLLDFNGTQLSELDFNETADNMTADESSQLPTGRFGGDEPLPTQDAFHILATLRRGSIPSAQQAFRDSIWLWTPALGDKGSAEATDFSLEISVNMLKTEGLDPGPIRDQLTLASRDNILVNILSTYPVAAHPLLVSSFPSPEALTQLMNMAMAHHLRGNASWIHAPTLKINEEEPEFSGALIALGATTSRIPEIRRFGFAIQEAVRLALQEAFEHDNRNRRKMRMLQAYTLHLDIALWSGDRRKMEIAESSALPLITMMRRAGKFRRNRHPDAAVRAGDDARMTELKWRDWVEAESFKRLALHLLIRDVQSSTSLLIPPLISYSELSLELPYSRDLWCAKTASEWKSLYLAKVGETEVHLPAIRHCINDPGVIFREVNIADVPMTFAVILSSIWSLIWQYRQMKQTLGYNSGGSSQAAGLMANSLHQETTSARLIQHLTLSAAESGGPMVPPARLLKELCLMHLHVLLEDIQLLAGKEGEEEARKVLPGLNTWAESAESRQAIFHAGQIIRAAEHYADGMLRYASAVGVYHAGLVLWAYSVLSQTAKRNQSTHTANSHPMSSRGPGTAAYVMLDGEDGPELQRFLVLGKGMPSIRRRPEAGGDGQESIVLLTYPVALMSTITDLLKRKNFVDDSSCPPLITNLCKLMKSLGHAAAAVF